MESRDQGLGIRSSAFGILLGLRLFLTFSGAVIAGDRTGNGAESRLGISVRVQDYAHVAPKILNEAQREATNILSETGIGVAWVECTGTGLPSEPTCAQPFRATDLALRILPQSMAERLPLNGDAFGFAAVSTDDRPSFLASVLYHRVEDLARTLGHSRAAMLGYVMAHEIGHLLLGTNSHSPLGIMRARLTREDLLRPLGFNSGQAEVIRAQVGVRSRLATQELEMATGTPATRAVQ